MKFIIKRTSNLGGDEPPCVGCTEEKFNRLDVRTLPTFEAYEKKFGESFLGEGINHKENANGTIQREFVDDRTEFTKEINTLEELLKWADEQTSEIVIGIANSIIPKHYSIEIYDDYRE